MGASRDVYNRFWVQVLFFFYKNYALVSGQYKMASTTRLQSLFTQLHHAIVILTWCVNSQDYRETRNKLEFEPDSG